MDVIIAVSLVTQDKPLFLSEAIKTEASAIFIFLKILFCKIRKEYFQENLNLLFCCMGDL